MLNIFNKKRNSCNKNLLHVYNLNNNTTNNLTKNENENYNVIDFTKHYTPNNQQWCNSIYVYNKNYVKYIPVLDNIINSLILSFFNMTFTFTKNIRSVHRRITYKRKLINKIFVSKALLNHTNDKIIITLFTYNREKFYIMKKMHVLYNKLSKTLIKLCRLIKFKTIKKTQTNKNKIYFHFKKRRSFKNHMLKNAYLLYIGKYILKKKVTTLISKITVSDIHVFIDKKKKNETKLIFRTLKKKDIATIRIKRKFLMLFKLLNKNYNQYIDIVFSLHKLYLYHNKILLLNNYKYKDFLLSNLKAFISSFYNNNVEFRIINLKKLSLNSDIFIQASVEKLKNRKNKLLKVLNKSLSLVKPMFINKYKILDPNLKNKKKVSFINKYNCSEFLNKMFSYNNNNIFCVKNTNKLNINILNNINNKFVIGIKLQAAGRLTRRLIASRSLFKLKYKGNLKNINSSYKGLSCEILKGHMKSNNQYTLINSKTRNGSFGLRG